VSETCDKKADARFSLQFNQTDPAHLQVAGILNRIGRRGKAQYIVDAVLFYESHGGVSDTKRMAPTDEKFIETVVKKTLSYIGISPGAAPLGTVTSQPPAEDIDVIEALGVDGIEAITSALDMFRKKE